MHPAESASISTPFHPAQLRHVRGRGARRIRMLTALHQDGHALRLACFRSLVVNAIPALESGRSKRLTSPGVLMRTCAREPFTDSIICFVTALAGPGRAGTDSSTSGTARCRATRR